MTFAFDTLLVANRGEIACRIMRSAHALGLKTVAVYSDADASAAHVEMADMAVRLGPAPAAQSYLRADLVIEAALSAGAGAVHPGYGFLSENAEFAAAVQDAGLTWIGPPVAAVAAMGSKIEAKKMMAAAGVPVLDELHPDHVTDAQLPVLVKASAGGGGRGMRMVRSADELPTAVEGARHEAQAFFGNDRLLLERVIENARHIEVQVLGDHHGNVLHFFERDCSLQRRYQKVIEEAPARGLAPELRARILNDAIRLSREVGLTNAATVEFLVAAATGEYYFLEVNPRLQVEHPVTEAVCGIDLVALQLAVAQGRPLELRQEDIRPQGHSIEVRIYGEAPTEEGFLPTAGRIRHWRPPATLRTEHALRDGLRVTTEFDTLLAKCIASGAHFEQVREKLIHSLATLNLSGMKTNTAYLLHALRAMKSTPPITSFLTEQHDTLYHQANDPALLDAALIAYACLAVKRDVDRLDAFEQLRFEQPGSPARFILKVSLRSSIDEQQSHYSVEFQKPSQTLERLEALCAIDEREYHCVGRFHPQTRQLEAVELNGRAFRLESARGLPGAGAGLSTTLFLEGHWFEVAPTAATRTAVEQETDSTHRLLAPLPGRVLKVCMERGQVCSPGETLAIIESMKMEHRLRAVEPVQVASVVVSAGQNVAAGEVLALFVVPTEKQPQSTEVSGKK
ncbi:MAG: ATP-grasp domain-containing protein [Bdellovibrionales bacterium]|nr:ATP-grasp domain-containing protein [Bdellovibrionales bacterium]